ncbi:S-layer homology domain-containing protein [Paenibacillus hodogayensis]|uniref:S-layer homology domain-containing protein n=1 Tax=Paenibacillus hodogayensis TaxID=279208 RepID=A0ABV5VS21_9BACL
MSTNKFMKKTSVFLLIAILLSMLVPVLASAALVFSGTYASNGSITGQLRFDGTVGQEVYGQQNVTLGVYNANGQHLQDVTVTFASYADGASNYSLPDDTVLHSVYDAVYFKYGATDVTGLIYRQSDDSNTDPEEGNGGNSGGGGSGSPGSSDGSTNGGGSSGGGSGGSGSGQTGDVTDTLNAVNGTVDAEQLKAALDKYTEVTIKVDGDSVAIPAAGISYAKPNSILNIVTRNGSYILPLSAFSLSDLASQVETDVNAMKIHVGIQELSGDAASAVKVAIQQLDGKPLSAAYEMTFAIEGTGGAKKNIANFDQYVKRIIPLTETPTQSATIALYNPDTKRLSFVPGSISASDSKATFWRTGNSIYTVLELNNSYNDISGHWAKNDIELLTNKLIVEGMTDTTFQPDRPLTRAEFVALATRSFGLVDVTDGTYFSDVGLSSWYSGMVGAAAKAGLIDGYEDDTFRPNAPITREELAAIIVRAYNYAGGRVTVDASEQAKLLSDYYDANEIVWGHTEVAKAISAGFMEGMSTHTLETDSTATRAQTVAMLKRVLTSVRFID